jgi:O-antigen/teichoic acid export membrane protein
VIGVLSTPYGLQMALLAILAQPVLIGLGVLLSTSDLRPATLWLGRDLARRIFSLGSPQFLGAIFILLGYQLERWAIAGVLGEAALGQFYLVIMYIAFFVLVPTAILNLYFPSALRSFQAGDMDGFAHSARRHLRDLAVFSAVALPATIFLLPWLLERVLPQFAGQAYLVYWAYPAMVVFVARDACALAFLSMKQTMPLVVSGALFFGSYALCVGLLVLSGQFSLVTLLASRLVASAVALVYAVIKRWQLLEAHRKGEVAVQ